MSNPNHLHFPDCGNTVNHYINGNCDFCLFLNSEEDPCLAVVKWIENWDL